LDRGCGKDRWLGTIKTQDENIRRISDAKLWNLRSLKSAGLIDYVRQRLSLNMAASGNPSKAVEFAKNILDPIF
jgi:starch phosphorylase